MSNWDRQVCLVVYRKPVTAMPGVCPRRMMDGCNFDRKHVYAVLSDFDYVFSENGLVAYKRGQLVAVQSLR